MNRIQDYQDYRHYLREQLHEIREKKACYSYRRIAQKLTVDPGQLVKILQSKRHVSKRLIPVFAEFLSLKERDLEYFTWLIYYDKAKDKCKKKFYLEKLIQLKEIKVDNFSNSAQ